MFRLMIEFVTKGEMFTLQKTVVYMHLFHKKLLNE